jgi:hypothetical protein
MRAIRSASDQLGLRLHTSAVAASRRRRRNVLVALLLVDVIGTLMARALGYGVGGNTLVRCRRGHLFTTIWIPGVSFKSLRLGWWRIQRCPVGRHWSIVAPVKEAALSEAEVEAAHAVKDIRIP